VSSRWKWQRGTCDDCCGSPCTVWNETILDHWPGTTFDDNWLIYNAISYPDFDLDSANSGAVIIRQTDAADAAATLTATFAATSNMPTGEELRFIIAAENQAAYLYADLYVFGGEIVAQLGSRESNTDTNAGSPVSVGGFKLNLDGEWQLCYSDDGNLRLLFDGTTVAQESLSLPSGSGKKSGFASTDWSDYNVTPLSFAAVYGDHYRDVDDYRECPKCEAKPPPQACSCEWSPYMLMTCATGSYLLPYTQTVSPNQPSVDCDSFCRCEYEDTFDIDPCDVRDSFGTLKTATKMKVLWYNSNCTPFNGVVYALIVTFKEADNTDILARQFAAYCGVFNQCPPDCNYGCNGEYRYTLYWSQTKSQCENLHFPGRYGQFNTGWADVTPVF